MSQIKKTATLKTTARKNVPVNPTVELLTEATWSFAHSVLWNGHPFCESTTTLSKKLIREYYENIPEEKIKFISEYFSRYCERVVLAKAYINRFSHRYIPHPCVWLNRKNPKGFAGTKVWLHKILLKRELESFALRNEIYREEKLSKASESTLSLI
jgi:hypothetical protein